MTLTDRRKNYAFQTNRSSYTPAQCRRMRKKTNHTLKLNGNFNVVVHTAFYARMNVNRIRAQYGNS